MTEILDEMSERYNLKYLDKLRLVEVARRFMKDNGKADDVDYRQAFSEILGIAPTKASFLQHIFVRLASYEREANREESPYTIPFAFTTTPRTIQELDALIHSIYPLSRFLNEKIDEDRHGKKYKNTTFNLESVHSSAFNYDCLIHSFLTCMSMRFRMLRQTQKDAFAYYFRRYICPRYLPISDFIHRRLLEERESIEIPELTYEEESRRDEGRNEMVRAINENETLVSTQKREAVSALQASWQMQKSLESAAKFVKEYYFLEDEQGKILAEAFQVNLVYIQLVAKGEVQPTLFHSKEGNTHTIFLYNPRDGHFRGVRRLGGESGTFLFSNEDAETIVAGLSPPPAALRTECNFAAGETVIHNGKEKKIQDIDYDDGRTGVLRCISVRFEGDLRTSVPISAIQKKPSSGGYHKTRKVKRR